MIKKVINYFDKLEDKTRKDLSKHPVIYALIGGVGVVLFWRGVWMMADEAGISSGTSIVISLITMLLTGVFVSYFVGDQVIISGLKGEKKLIDKTKDEIQKEEDILARLDQHIVSVEEELKEIKETIAKEG